LAATGRAGEVVVFSKMGCHLCEAVEAEVRSTRVIGTGLQVVYIDEDSVLHDKYWFRVPVVQIEGKDVFEANMIDREGEWKKKLARLLDK
jgi:Glutaredoxin-like domain (DUF836)